jgi:hypothetical protein
MLNAIPLGPAGLDPRAFHPTAEGQRALARLVACYLADFPAAPDPFLTAADGSQVLAPAPGSPGAPLACHGG